MGRYADSTRVLAGISQKELGIRSGLDQFVASTRVNRYELGVHEPDYKTAQRLAGVLGIPTAYLFADEDQMAELILAIGFSDQLVRRRLLDELRLTIGVRS